MAVSAYETLSGGVCPWLQAPLRQLDAMRGGGRLGHGWLLTGPEGTGKINLALTAARRLLEGAGDAVKLLGAREAATAMAERHEPTDHHPDLHWLFPESGRRTLTVDQIRVAAHTLSLTSLISQAKVLILEPADAMTTAAANALLKTLEEPSAETYLFLLSHQPGRLPATIRSRCQSLTVRPPAAAVTAKWLCGIDSALQPGDWFAFLDLAQGVPFRAITFKSSDFYKNYKELNSKFNLISTNRLDPQSVADEWLKGDVELALSWLTARLQTVIRARLAPDRVRKGSNRPAELSDAWQALTTRFLFQQLQNAELLLRQVGGGINVDLAVRALLLGFQPQGERS